jgi:hypothetical protein
MLMGQELACRLASHKLVTNKLVKVATNNYDAPPQNLYIKLVSPHHVDKRRNIHLISFDFINTSFVLPETCKKENKY